MDTRDLTRRLAELLRREQGALADFLVALAEFDQERRWLELGHASLFYFLHRELGLSKGAAFYRKTAAELIQRYPEVVEPLRDGRLCLTSVVELARVITPENRGEVVARFCHASKREAKAISAELCPAEAAPRREMVTLLQPAPAPPSQVFRSATHVSGSDRVPAAVVHPDEPGSRTAAPAGPAAVPGPRDEAEPLTGELRRLHVTVSRRFLAKLAAARDALSHSHPGADTEAVLEAGLDLLLAAQARRKGVVAKPRQAPPRCPGRPSQGATSMAARVGLTADDHDTARRVASVVAERTA
jgi:hypothetical protein